MSTILVPVDGSAAAMHAVEFAAKLAQNDPSLKLHLLNVQSPNLYGSLIEGIGSTVPLHQILREQGETVLEPYVKALEGRTIAFDAQVKNGRPAEVICNYARDHNSLRIVMGTGGTATSNYLFGSVAYAVVAASPAPVTLIR
ncbi:universal stress protein [Silvimonas iriomotensis]|uniref:Universal stress protein n=1 Tax=Silvimonas iriomotensis TaxID=449662 RepID=A0ABQ2P4I2_9NEIS|nr:universal stress protein [Silvimonas iriomotensis]GGP17722.1 universal stress protein [Silvimonas iriomotensis]